MGSSIFIGLIGSFIVLIEIIRYNPMDSYYSYGSKIIKTNKNKIYAEYIDKKKVNFPFKAIIFICYLYHVCLCSRTCHLQSICWNYKN